jgi:hypothetical protein
MSNQAIIYILIGCILFFVIIFFVASILNNKVKKKDNIKVNFKKNSSFLYSSYLVFSKLFITKRYIEKIKRKIEVIELTDSFTVNKKTMKFAYITMGSSAGIVGIMWYLDQSVYYILISILTIIIINKQTLNILVDRLDTKILNQFGHFINDVRHHYNEHGMIDEAIYDAVEEAEYEISLHGKKIYDVLTTSNVEEEVDKYYDRVPNRFFKSFLALSYTVQKFGDQVADNSSTFLKNLNYLKQEINMELLKRQRLAYLFNSLSIIAILPIFSIKPIENWASTSMPELLAYYKGPYGFVVGICLLFTVFISYQLVTRLRSSNDSSYIREPIFEKRILEIPFINRLIGNVVKKQYSRSMKMEKLIKSIGGRISIEQFYVSRFLYAAIGLILGVLIFINVHNVARENLLYSSYNFITLNNQIDESNEKMLLEFDEKYILRFSGKGVTKDELIEAISSENKINDRSLIEISANRIIEKIAVYENEYFKWWELMISILISVLFYYIPYFLLEFSRTVLRMNMEDEVIQFHTIILMLMYIERISVEDILEWIEMFSNVFKESINKCLYNFENGDIEALEQLKIDEPFPPFVKIVENLQASSDKITIEAAFDEIKLERGYYQDKRKQENEININKKSAWGRMIAFIPLTLTLLFYLIVPFVHYSFVQFMNYPSQIGN